VLEWLSLAGNELCAVSLGASLSSLGPLPAGLCLSLCNCGLSSDDLHLLFQLQLASLLLDDNALGDSGVSQISRPLAAGVRGGAWRALSELSLRNVAMGELGAAQIVAALERCAIRGILACPPPSPGIHSPPSRFILYLFYFI